MAHSIAPDTLFPQETTVATLHKLWRDQRGQDMTEYALMAAAMTSLTLAIVPEMLSIAMHIAEILQSVAKTILELAEPK